MSLYELQAEFVLQDELADIALVTPTPDSIAFDAMFDEVPDEFESELIEFIDNLWEFDS